MSGIFLVLSLIITIVFLIIGFKANKDDAQVQERISALSRKEESKTKLLRKKQLESSFQDRVIFPVTQMIFDKFQRIIPMSGKSWVRSKLTQAGYQKPHYLKVFLGTQLLTTCVAFGGMFGFTMLFGQINGLVGFMIAAFFGGMGYFLPLAWLMQESKKRQESIQKSLPDFLDILVICVEAGLGLDVAISKIIGLKTVKTSGYLREELQRYTRDVGFGMPRKEALLGIAERTGVDDLNTIINAIVQAYEMGSSVAHTLRVQSDTLRVKRLTKAEEKANKIPVKMVMPIYIFLFPAIFVCIFGPIAMVMVDAISSVMSN